MDARQDPVLSHRCLHLSRSAVNSSRMARAGRLEPRHRLAPVGSLASRGLRADPSGHEP
jgi:hypothetical protein